jgi:ATP-dependent exoDNAse (exonuclease V), alpha subunit - helicase superfamily I member
VFVGDDRQLLPVGEDQVCRAFTEAKSLYRLTDVLRHDGAILNLATATRQMAIGRAPFAGAHGGGSCVVAYRTREQWLSELLDLAASTEAFADPDFCRALAWTNKAVEGLNDRIHVRRYGVGAPQFLPGMTCVTVDAIPGPDGGQPLINSTMDVTIKRSNIITHRFRIEDIPGRPGFDLDDRAKELGIGDIPDDWKVWDLTVAFPGEYVNPVSFKVIHKDSEKQWNNVQKAIASSASAAVGDERRKLWDLYFKRKDCVGRLQPATALTIHKSQGSTFKNVWLHWSVDGWGSAPTAEQNQLAYVGITRAAESLHVVADQ